MIILEGPDGAGKSTLGKTLSERLNIPLIHTGGHQDRVAMYDAIEEILDNPNEAVIFDRISLISEQIYGPLLRDKNIFNNPFGQDMMMKLRNRQPAYIYVRPKDPQRIFEVQLQTKPHKDQKHINKVAKLLYWVLDSYDKVFVELQEYGFQHCIQYDYTSDSIELLIEWCKRYGKIA